VQPEKCTLVALNDSCDAAGASCPFPHKHDNGDLWSLGRAHSSVEPNQELINSLRSSTRPVAWCTKRVLLVCGSLLSLISLQSLILIPLPEGLAQLTSNEQLVLAGTLHGIHAITSRLSPMGASSGANVIEGESFKMTIFLTVTGMCRLLRCHR